MSQPTVSSDFTIIPMDSQELKSKKPRKPRVAKAQNSVIDPLSTVDAPVPAPPPKKKKVQPKDANAEPKDANAEPKEKKVKKEPKEKKEPKAKKEPKPQPKGKKEKKVIEEPEACPICIENYTPIIRKKCVCRYCNTDSCSKCIERYLIDSPQDAHCMHCKVNYNDATLQEICTMTYIQQVYFKHRQEVLINRERANLPGLQEAALEEKERLDVKKQAEALMEKNKQVVDEYNKIKQEYYRLYDEKCKYNYRTNEYYELDKKCQIVYAQYATASNKMATVKNSIRDLWRDYKKRLNERNGNDEETTKKAEDKEEKKKFIRRCTRDGCQGFLSTAWKCALCEYYSCNKCFKPKGKDHDAPHECVKEDVETADLIKKDSKPCPKCGEFITKSSGCSQMFCISCQTPWDWNTGKIVKTGMIHNPHYYEWMRRNGNDGQMQRNPLDVPCGGYPQTWELRRFPRNSPIKEFKKLVDAFNEFHRICLEIQDISTTSFRSHIDNATTDNININFLLNVYDEKHWGHLLAKNEKKRKRDLEVQDIFTAFRMVAVELINRIQNYTEVSDSGIEYIITTLPQQRIIDILTTWKVEVDALIEMINNALRDVSIRYHYIVPQITIQTNDSLRYNYLPDFHYRIAHKNFYEDIKQARPRKQKKPGEPGDLKNGEEDLKDSGEQGDFKEKPACAGAGMGDDSIDNIV